jgi:hypothetical protein
VTRSIAVQPLLEEAGLPYELRRVALRRHGRQDWPGHLPSSIDRERQSSRLKQTSPPDKVGVDDKVSSARWTESSFSVLISSPPAP